MPYLQLATNVWKDPFGKTYVKSDIEARRSAMQMLKVASPSLEYKVYIYEHKNDRAPKAFVKLVDSPSFMHFGYFTKTKDGVWDDHLINEDGKLYRNGTKAYIVKINARGDIVRRN